VSAAARPLAARAQKSTNMRRVGVLMSWASDDSLGQAYNAAFAQGLQQLGWEIGSNIRIDYRWGSGDTERFRKCAAELVAHRREFIAGLGGAAIAPPLLVLAEQGKVAKIGVLLLGYPGCRRRDKGTAPNFSVHLRDHLLDERAKTSRMIVSIGSIQLSKSCADCSVDGCISQAVVTFVMAWSPARRSYAG
jgi:putative ABC transport system substrate-binding protein